MSWTERRNLDSRNRRSRTIRFIFSMRMRTELSMVLPVLASDPPVTFPAVAAGGVDIQTGDQEQIYNFEGAIRSIDYGGAAFRDIREHSWMKHRNVLSIAEPD